MQSQSSPLDAQHEYQGNQSKAESGIRATTLIIIVSLFLMAFGNRAFFNNVYATYADGSHTLLYLASLYLSFSALTVIILSVLTIRLIKPVLIILLITSSLAAYFMDSYNVFIDSTMVDNIARTDSGESLDLLSLKLFIYVTLLGLLPSWWIWRTRIQAQKLGSSLVSRAQLSALAFALILLNVLSLGSFYTSFIREHKQLRYYLNPASYLYASAQFVREKVHGSQLDFTQIAMDAAIPGADAHRELIIFVVGEAARADRFSLNGYARQTNPDLEHENVISLRDFWSCGTSTAVSVPCMFSVYRHDEFDHERGLATENLLDITYRTGVNTLWIDNNSDSKGVAVRIPYLSYRSPDVNPVCDVECRDIGMLSMVQQYIDEHPQGDILIVLHQIGNHGPAYYKRYPKSFERFLPVCESNQLEECTQEQIRNTYDNAILYTDHFLASIIELLKRNNQGFESALVYTSDHGESLGEHGIYLHGLPYYLASEEQKHVPTIFWFNDFISAHEIDVSDLTQRKDQRFSHDNIFHTLLGLLEIRTESYDPSLDILKHMEEFPDEVAG